ncbi:MAG: beta-propeller fold lactonase family protein [Ginsengibacter sp.]
MRKNFFIGVFIICLFNSLYGQNKFTYLTVPGTEQFTHIDKDGITVLPSGRFVTPAGAVIQITRSPFGMAISPDGKKSVVLHNGVITIVNNETMKSIRVPSYDSTIASPFSNGSFLGVAFSTDSKELFLSGGDNGAVLFYDINNLKRTDSISLNGYFNHRFYQDSFTSDILLNASNNELLVLDRGNFRMVRINRSTKTISGSVTCGRQPFGLALSPDAKFAFVANVGMYDYPILPGLTKTNAAKKMLPFHPYADNSKESIEGYVYRGQKVPGVGNPNSPEAMSVYTIDLTTNKVLDRFKTGYKVGQMVEGSEVTGGASPNSIAVGEKYAYVTNATNDNISIIDYNHHKIVGEIPLKIDSRIDKFRGYLPFGISLSKDERFLYVALLGFNAVAVIDIKSKTVKGLIPTGWGPTRVKISADGNELYVVSCRGYGAGPNGGANFIKPVQGTYIGDIQLGTFQKIVIPDSGSLANYTRQVIQNTFIEKEVTIPVAKNPLPAVVGTAKSPIKYVVYITKENRTYDEILGQLTSGNGDTTLARFGIHTNINEDVNAVTFSKIPLAHSDILKNVDISPNHLKVASQFAFSDNFYCDSDASIHGHHWMMGVIPNEWVEANSSVSKTAKIFSKASGRRFPGSTGSMDPEDYAEKGGLWEALARKKVSFYNFGEANETAHVREEWQDTLTGAAHAVMVPMQKALWSKTSHDYAGFNTNIPDQFRMDQFERNFAKKWLYGKDKMPSLVTIQIPNDHTADPRAKDGYPFKHSYVADNDLAVGRVLHFLSRTPYWKNMLVIITEDDPQGGVDHIDAHRSILMLAGPYVKHSYTSHTHANFGSILKIIYNVLSVPYVNQYDATASLLQDFFTSTPDYTPYDLVMPSKSVFDPKKAMARYNKNIDWKKIIKGPDMDDEHEVKRRLN